MNARSTMKVGGLLCALAIGLGFGLVPVQPDSIAPVDSAAVDLERRLAEDVRPILDAYCIDCHGERRRKGKVRLDALASIHDIVNLGETLDLAHEMLSTGEMPPEDEVRPTEHEALVVMQWIRDAADYYPADGAIDPGWFTIHRLNQAEYRNTMRDLLGVDADEIDLTAGLPPDDTGYGFDNNADVLTISPLHLDRYLTAAERALDYALGPVVSINDEPVMLPHLRMSGGGNALPRGGFYLYTNGAVEGTFEAPIAGTYEIEFSSWGTPGGDEDPRLSVRVDRKEVESFWIPARRDNPQTERVRLNLAAGRHVIAGHFTNDYYEQDVADRNLGIDFIAVAGPLTIDDDARPAGYARVFGSESALTKSGAARTIISDFAARAFRRPVTNEEIEPLLALYRGALAAGDEREEAIRLALTACLVSPRFLYRAVVPGESVDAMGTQRLDAFELASRLSYFLWSSMPDDALFAAAESGALLDDDTLREQVGRMLADTKSEAFIENFVGQWLQLRNLAEVEFDQERFPEFDDGLRASMITEATLFFGDVVRSNRSVLDLIDSQDTFVDQRLASLYGLPDAPRRGFQRVELPESSPRGGVITMAGVLAVTSYPTRTSPVRRGLFVLDEILGVPPPPPPPDIPPLEQAQQIVGPEATLREQLQAHLNDATCASCHRRMDPIGLAMENFSPTGAWRNVVSGTPIDASGALPGGVAFSGASELKKILLARERQFVENLCKKVLTYALGRGPEPFDRPAIGRMVRQTRDADGRFGALVEAIVLSDTFRSYRQRSASHDPTE